MAYQMVDYIIYGDGGSSRGSPNGLYVYWGTWNGKDAWYYETDVWVWGLWYGKNADGFWGYIISQGGFTTAGQYWSNEWGFPSSEIPYYPYNGATGSPQTDVYRARVITTGD